MRRPGIEPGAYGWEPYMLPLHQRRYHSGKKFQSTAWHSYRKVQKVENRGFDPRASCLQSTHSTDWANPPDNQEKIAMRVNTNYQCDYELQKVENRGFDPRASSLLTTHSTNWANPPTVGSWIRHGLIPHDRVGLRLGWILSCMKMKKWRMRVSIPLPRRCERRTLPIELIPHDALKSNSIQIKRHVIVAAHANCVFRVALPLWPEQKYTLQ
jgi:hypothetical protein